MDSSFHFLVLLTIAKTILFLWQRMFLSRFLGVQNHQFSHFFKFFYSIGKFFINLHKFCIKIEPIFRITLVLKSPSLDIIFDQMHICEIFFSVKVPKNWIQAIFFSLEST